MEASANMRRIIGRQCFEQMQRLRRAGVPYWLRIPLGIECRDLLALLDDGPTGGPQWDEALTRLQALRETVTAGIRQYQNR